jgi:putative transcriptional regulator
MNNNKRVFNRIKGVIADNRKTGKWLASQLGVNASTVSKWCTNEMQPTVEMLFNIADALEVDVRELLVSNKV